MRYIILLSLLFANPIFAETKENVKKQETKKIIVKKEETAIELPGMIVVADRKYSALTTDSPEKEQERTPGAVSIIDGNVLDMAPRPGGLSDILKYTPGVYTESRYGNGESKISIRGSGVINNSGGGINYLRDGIPLMLGDSFITTTDVVDTSMADSVTVYRGSDALKYGGATLGGAVNIISKTGRTFDKNRIKYMGGSNNFNQVQLESGGVLKSNSKVDYYGNFQYTTNDGYRDWSKEQLYRTFGNVGYRWNDSNETRAYLTMSRNDLQMPGSLPLNDVASSMKTQDGIIKAHINTPTGAVVNTPTYLTTPYTQSGAIGSTNPMAAEYQSQAQNTGRYVDLLRFDLKHTLMVSSEQKLDFTSSYLGRHLDHPIPDTFIQDQNVFSGSMTYTDNRSLFNFNNEFIAGANTAYHTISGSVKCREAISTCSDPSLFGTSGSTYKEPNRSDAASTSIAFLQDSFEFYKNIKLVAGLQGGVATRSRYSDVTTMTTSAYPYGAHEEKFSETYLGISPKIGLIWDASRTMQFYGNVSRGWEPPNDAQFATTVAGVTPKLPANCKGTNAVLSKSCVAQTTYGNANLKSQTSTTYEIGTRGSQETKNFGDFKFDFATYRTDVRNEILSQTNSLNPLLTVSSNADHTRHIGIELMLQNDKHLGITQGDNLRTTTIYNWINFQFNNDVLWGNNVLPGIPSNFGTIETLYQHRSGIYVGPTGKFVDSYYSDFANQKDWRVPAVALLGMKAGYNANKALNLFIEARNILGTQWISNVKAADKTTASSLIYNPGYGAQVYGGVSYDF